MTKKLWQASLNQKKNSNLFQFEKYISNKFNIKLNQKYDSKSYTTSNSINSKVKWSLTDNKSAFHKIIYKNYKNESWEQDLKPSIY